MMMTDHEEEDASPADDERVYEISCIPKIKERSLHSLLRMFLHSLLRMFLPSLSLYSSLFCWLQDDQVQEISQE